MSKQLKEGVDGFAFMSWEQNPKKRNINNVVKFNVNNHVEINIGDTLLGEKLLPYQSTYTITEIVSERPSNMKGKKYVEVRTSWENANVTHTEA